MENQHRKITGYRELDEVEIAAINSIKEAGVRLDELVKHVRLHIGDLRRMANAAPKYLDNTHDANPAEIARLDAAEPERWTSIARTHFQEGLMALTRAVAQPGSF